MPRPADMLTGSRGRQGAGRADEAERRDPSHWRRLDAALTYQAHQVSHQPHATRTEDEGLLSTHFGLIQTDHPLTQRPAGGQPFGNQNTGHAPASCRLPSERKAMKPLPLPLASHEGELLTVEQAADRIRMSARYVRRLIAERRIGFYRLGRSVRIDPADLTAFVIAGRIEPITETSVWADLKGVG